MKIFIQNSSLVFKTGATNLLSGMTYTGGYRQPGGGASITTNASYWCTDTLVAIPEGATALTLSFDAKNSSSAVKMLWFDNSGTQVTSPTEHSEGSPTIFDIPTGAKKFSIQGNLSAFTHSELASASSCRCWVSA